MTRSPGTVQGKSLGDLLQQVLKETSHRKRVLLYRVAGAGRLVEALKAEVDRSKRADAAKTLLAGKRALEASRWASEPAAKPQGHWALAIALSVQGRYEAALVHFEAARSGYQTLSLEVEAARVALGQVQPLAMLGRLQEAGDLAEATRRTFLTYGCKHEAAKTDNNLGIIYTTRGAFDLAERALLRALETHEALGNDEEQMLSHINLGDVYQEQDRFKEAATHLHTALALAKKLDKRRSAAGTTLNLALLYRRQGRLADALELLTQLRNLYPPGDSPDASSPDANLARLEEARVRLDLNLLDEAKNIAEPLVAAFTRSDMKMEQAETLTLLGEIQTKRGQRWEARAALHEAHALWQRLGNGVQARLLELYLALLDLVGASDEARADQALTSALTRAQGATAALAEYGRTSGTVLGLLVTAEAQLALGDLPAAQQTVDKAVEEARDLGITDLLIRSAHLAGRVAYRRGHTGAAERHYREAVGALESVRATLAVDEFKATYLGDKLNVYDDLVALLLEQGRVHEAFAFVERAKSRTLLELLVRGVTPQSATGDARVTELVRHLEEAREELHWHTLGAPGQPGDTRRAKIRAAESRVTTLLRDLEQHLETAPLEPEALPALADVTELLGKDTVLLEYFGSGDRLSAFVITREGVRFVAQIASLTDVTCALKRLEFYLSRVALGGMHVQVYGEKRLQQRVDDQLRVLYGQLLAPLDLELAKNLVVVPHGSLYSVPFAALYDGEGYLLDKTRVSLAPSAAVYRFCKTKRLSGGPLVTFGVPTDTLPAVREEVAAVVEGLEAAQTFVGERATRSAFFEQAPAASLLHLATHGSYRPDNPMFSGLKLADGWLNARDLYATRLQAALVVLSACDSGLTKSYGVEPFGLVRGFLHAGATSLVTSLWPVKDKQTAEFMHLFYARLKRGDDIAAALREAQSQLRSRYPNPYYWAGFNVLGDATRSVELTGPG